MSEKPKEQTQVPWDKITLPYKEDEEFKYVWSEYVKMRLKIKKPLTEYGEYLGMKKMQREGWDKERAIDALNYSIFKTYQGIFEDPERKPVQRYIGGSTY